MSTQSMLALLDSDPAAGLRAAADLREQRANAAVTDGAASPWYVAEERACACCRSIRGRGGVLLGESDDRYGEHIAAEANPAHALAAVRHWRGVAERHGEPGHVCVSGVRHGQWESVDEGQGGARFLPEPCPDLVETVDDAKAYLGGTP